MEDSFIFFALKAKSTLLLVIPDEHLLKFHGIKDAKTLWEAIKARQLEIHGEVISQEDANLKLLRSLPSAWNNIALIMRNKSDLDTLSMDDLYNNLKVYEAEIKGQSSLNSNSQNVAFVSSKNTSSTNEEVNTAHEISTASSQGQASSSTYADDVMFSFFVNQSNSPRLDKIWSRLILMIMKRWISNGSSHLPTTEYYMPSRPDLSFVGLDDSVYKTYVSDTISSVPRIKSIASKSSKDSLEQPKKVRPSAPIIEEWESDSDNDSVFRPKSDQTKPKFTKINFVKSDENVKTVNKENTHRQEECPKEKSKS
ncbi:hypothetical protein Tco_1082235 [Tanacetum coccineum]|uniref:Uncharacterized protein n=1 Tax=Tanacetum coccineum TaxID=301880 RepID=A0ABQ5I1A3_9ASTR